MCRLIFAVNLLLFSVVSIAGAPGGLKILSYTFTSNTNYSKQIDGVFDRDSSIECYKDHEILLGIDSYYNDTNRLKNIDDNLLVGAINNHENIRKVQKILSEYSDKRIDGFDAIIFHTVDTNYVNLYIISPEVNRTLSTRILKTDVDNEDKLRKAIFNILVDVPVWGP